MITGLAFLILGLYLTVSSLRLPSGPALFPRVLGILMILLALAAWRDRRPATPIENGRTIAATLALTVLYLLLWGTGGFALKTALYLLALLRIYGQGWRSATGVSLILTALVTLGFQIGLRLTLE